MIRAEQVSKTFNEGTPQAFQALWDISLHVKQGECVLLTGASGSGKSTLLALCAGLYQPSQGSIHVAKEPLSSLPEHFASRLRRKHIGIIFQQFHLIPRLSVLHNLALPALPDGVDTTPRAQELLKRFGLFERQHTLASFLSGGEQQRVALIRALINDPDIILADEPSANLDATLTKELLKTFDALREAGKTLLIATHDPLLLKWNSNHVALSHGRRV
ncbi:MAG: ABC transporter ATP-binding protein [Campylobacterales bacterium]|nr:ABC transporter ATP-binding protein [Campylobacterales bacterium]